MMIAMEPLPYLPLVLALLGAPMLRSVINRTKAWFAGRRGPPLLQPYRDLRKLLSKGAVYSRTTTWMFRMGPAVGLSTVIVAALLVPMATIAAPFAFVGDLFLFGYLLALGRLFTVLAALDTGSPFEGMGANREVYFSALTEPVLLLCLATLARQTDSLSLSRIYPAVGVFSWSDATPLLVLVAAAMLIVFLTENARIPVDDPTTHLELTMIHEVMVLDHGGPDLAFIEYTVALKLWVVGQLIVGIFVPATQLTLWGAMLADVVGLFVLAVLVGVVESTMARLRMPNVPQLLLGAGALAAMAWLLVLQVGS